MLLWIHPSDGVRFGVTAHDTTPDISRPLGYEYYPTQNSHAKAVLKAGVPQVFLSVLVPFDDGRPAGDIASKIETKVETGGECTATIGSTTVTIAPDGSYNVTR